jgi:hypothetical protein
MILNKKNLFELVATKLPDITSNNGEIDIDHGIGGWHDIDLPTEQVYIVTGIKNNYQYWLKFTRTVSSIPEIGTAEQGIWKAIYLIDDVSSQYNNQPRRNLDFGDMCDDVRLKLQRLS